MNYDFSNIISKFAIDGKLIFSEPYGEGHINQTFLVRMANGEMQTDYIVQKINHNIFKNVEGLMNNIVLVTENNRKKVAQANGNPDRESLSLVYAKDGKSYCYFEEDDGYFRVYKFITDSVAYQTVEKPEHFYESARAFGNFALLLSEFNANELYETIPDFHNTEKRFKDFLASLKADKMGRASSVKDEIEFVLNRKDYCGVIVEKLKSGEMPTRVTHNDTKLNNVLIDKDTGKYVAVIDLDTIMPGSLCYDFGDSIRFGCNPASEDEKDLSKVNFDIDLFKAYAKGYLSAVKDGITEVEKNNLSMGAILMTYECGMRFLADYLDGDVYFNTKRKGQNLDRARTQFKLVSDMEKMYDDMQKIIKEC